MSNQSKGARLWLRPPADDREATWIIRDGEKQRSTGCGAADVGEAEQRLAAYVATKHQPPVDRLEPRSVSIADVISLYATDSITRVSRPTALTQRLRFLVEFWGDKTLSEVNPTTCRAYVNHRHSGTAARRELEDLRAAIGNHWRQGLCDRNLGPLVSLPDKSPSRERWLTRDEVAKLIRAAWRYRQPQGAIITDRRMRQHLARFILVGLYTGTRASTICAASFHQGEGRGFVDVDHGVFYRLPQGELQTNKRRPTIRIPLRLLSHMRRWRANGSGSVVEFDGRAVGSVKKAFARLVGEIGLEGVTQHTLRHTAITWAMQNRADIYEASGFFGVSPKLIVDVYGHHHPDYQGDVARAVTARPAQVRHRLAGTKRDETAQTVQA